MHEVLVPERQGDSPRVQSLPSLMVKGPAAQASNRQLCFSAANNSSIEAVVSNVIP